MKFEIYFNVGYRKVHGRLVLTTQYFAIFLNTLLFVQYLIAMPAHYRHHHQRCYQYHYYPYHHEDKQFG